MKKTNAMRFLDQKKVIYDVLEYDLSDELIDGISVAKKIGLRADEVYKTLVIIGHSKQYYVAMIPVHMNLNLKAIAKLVSEKKVEMIHVKDIQKVTGYLRGGCSPIGMKKHFPLVIDHSLENLEMMTFSAGKKGLQLKMHTEDFILTFQPLIGQITD